MWNKGWIVLCLSITLFCRQSIRYIDITHEQLGWWEFNLNRQLAGGHSMLRVHCRIQFYRQSAGCTLYRVIDWASDIGSQLGWLNPEDDICLLSLMWLCTHRLNSYVYRDDAPSAYWYRLNSLHSCVQCQHIESFLIKYQTQIINDMCTCILLLPAILTVTCILIWLVCYRSQDRA